jgi:hypothetical protein
MIQPETFAQANPFITGFGAGQQLINQGMQNQYQNYQNQIAAAQAQYANPMAAAQLAYTQQQAPNMAAQTQGILQGQIPEEQGLGAYYGAQGNLVSGRTPALIQQANNSIYTNPLLANAQQLQQAANQGLNPTLQQLNLPNVAPNGTVNSGPLTSAGIPIPTPNGQVPSQLPANSAPPQSIASQAVQAAFGPGFMGQGNLVTSKGVYPNQPGQAENPGQQANYDYLFNPLAFQQLQAAAKTTGSTGVETYNDLLKNSSDQSQQANLLANASDQYLSNYNRSTYKGSLLGNIPVRGEHSWAAPGDLSPEQETDAAATNLGALVAKTYFPGRVTNTDMQYVQTMKPGRNVDQSAANDMASSVKAVAQRAQEYPSFLNAAKSDGVDPQTAQTLWTQYINQRPVFDYQNHQVRRNFLGSYNDFLNPKAIQAAQSGATYVPKPTFDNRAQAATWYQGLTPQQQQYVTSTYGSKAGGRQ